MILFTALTLAALIFTIIAIILLITGGAAFTVVFGDLIVCVLLIALLIRFVFKKEK